MSKNMYKKLVMITCCMVVMAVQRAVGQVHDGVDLSRLGRTVYTKNIADTVLMQYVPPLYFENELKRGGSFALFKNRCKVKIGFNDMNVVNVGYDNGTIILTIRAYYRKNNRFAFFKVGNKVPFDFTQWHALDEPKNFTDHQSGDYLGKNGSGKIEMTQQVKPDFEYVMYAHADVLLAPAQPENVQKQEEMVVPAPIMNVVQPIPAGVIPLVNHVSAPKKNVPENQAVKMAVNAEVKVVQNQDLVNTGVIFPPVVKDNGIQKTVASVIVKLLGLLYCALPDSNFAKPVKEVLNEGRTYWLFRR